MKELVIWALPAGATDRLHERPIAYHCRNREDVQRVIDASTADGWHGHRIQVLDGTLPDFGATVMV